MIDRSEYAKAWVFDTPIGKYELDIEVARNVLGFKQGWMAFMSLYEWYTNDKRSKGYVNDGWFAFDEQTLDSLRTMVEEYLEECLVDAPTEIVDKAEEFLKNRYRLAVLE